MLLKKEEKELKFRSQEEKNKRKSMKIEIPRTAQDTIPFKTVYENGVIKVTDELYCIICSFSNINYILRREDEQKVLFNQYCDVLNSLDPTLKFQLYLTNKSIDEDELCKALIPQGNRNDGLEEIHETYKKVQKIFIKESYNQTADKCNYFVLGYETKNKNEDVEAILKKAFRETSASLKKLGSDSKILTCIEILELFYNFYNPIKAKEDKFTLPKNIYKRGVKIKDYIAPSSFKFKNNYVEMGTAYSRTLYIRDFPESIKDTLLCDLMDSPNIISTSVHIESKDPTESMDYIKKKIIALESQAQDRKKKNRREGTDYIPYELRTALEESNELLDNLLKKNQRMFVVSVYINISAASLEELEDITKTVNRVARKHLVSVDLLTHRQEQGMNSILPLANDKSGIKRLLLTDSTAILIPFSAQNMFEPGGFYYGRNSITNSMVAIDRKQLKVSNGFILGISGSGKSFKEKREIIDILELTDDDVIIIDPEREFTPLCDAYNGELIEISPSSKTHLNPMDVSMDYADDDDPIQLKSDFIMSIVETAKGELTSIEKTIVDRCVKISYKPFIENNWNQDFIPTFKDFYRIIKEQPEPQAKDIALAIELYVTGSLNTFSEHSNITLKNRLTVFDTKDLGKQLKKLGSLITLDTIWSIISANKSKGKYTWIITDEFYIFFDDEDGKTSYSAEYYYQLYKRSRKWGGIVTGITQNIEDLLQSPKARTMLANSQFLILLDQAPTDRAQLLKLLNLSDSQEAYITNAETGCGLLICGKNVIPIEDEYPKDNIIYKMITTKLSEIA